MVELQKVQRQFSAGGIVFKDSSVLLVKNASIKDKKIEFWGFPKGHIEGKESSKEAALREVKEEAGIEAEIIEKIGDSTYIFTQNGEKIFKVVIMYLMNYLSGDVSDHDHEIIEASWFDPEDALKLLSFSNDKTLLKKALGKLNG